MENVLIVFSCDEWKDYASMRVLAVCENMDAVKRIIDGEVSRGDMKIDGVLNALDGVREINNALTYGYVEQWKVQKE